MQNSAGDRQLLEKAYGRGRQARGMRLGDRQVRRPLADRTRGLRQVEHHQKQAEERSHDGRDVEDEKARHQETESGVRQRLSGQFAARLRQLVTCGWRHFTTSCYLLSLKTLQVGLPP